MNPFIIFLIRLFTAIPAIAIVWLISYFGLNRSFLVSTVFSLVGGFLVSWGSSLLVQHRFIKRNHLTRKEYRYIKKNLDEAGQKISRLQKALLSIHNIQSLKYRVEFIKIVRKIYRLTKKEPRRFYFAESFYFSHLDSAVELSEKYIFLSTQPKITPELDQSLGEALLLLEKMKPLIEEDLYKVISEDQEQLDYEIDVARQTLERKSNIDQGHDGK